MSQTVEAQIDSYLASQTMPAQELVVDPQFKNLRMITPVGRFANIHVDKPFAIPAKPPALPNAPKFSAQLLMAGGTEQTPIVADIYKAICMVADASWAPQQRPHPQNPSQMVLMKASELLSVPENLGGIHYPLRSGNEMYMKDMQKYAMWRGLFFINASMYAQTKSGQPQNPICLDESGNNCDPTKFYPGCYGRMQITVASFENNGKRGVTFYINAVQFARHGERMASFDAGNAAKSAFAAVGTLPADTGQVPGGFAPGYGPHTASSASVPPGTPFGFAAPPAQVAPQPQQGFAQPGAFAAPPPQVNPGFGRPPGV